jgi:hypothetical protein
LPSPSSRVRRAIPHLVAAFVLFHLVASCVAVIPDLGGGLDRRAWRDARAQRELQAWADRFGMARPEFEARIFDVAVGFQETRRTMARPFARYLWATGVQQSWAMFSAGTPLSDRFGVRMRRCPTRDTSCEWETLFIHGDAEHAWRRAVIGHPRVRSAIFRWSWPSYADRYRRGCRAIAGLVFADFPDAVAAECSFERTATPSPASPSPPPPEWSRRVTVRR